MFFNWLRLKPRPRPLCALKATRNRRQLRLDPLEDRLAPATFTVTTTLDVVDPADGKLSLREAISRANARVGGDTIILPAGVIKISIAGGDENLNATGDFDISGDTAIHGAGVGATVINAQQIDRVFDVLGTAPSSIRVAFQGLTIINGLTNGNGGGILYGNADLALRDCAVTGNRAAISGGGISNSALQGSGNLTLVRTLVNRNVAVLSGGGVAVQSNTLVARDSSIRRNIVTVGTGGGVLATTAILTCCTISGNSASDAGGINGSTTNLTNCVISGNFSIGPAGGVQAGTAILVGCTVSGNHAGDGGGGIDTAFGTATLISCTVSGNSAGADGGGIRSRTVTLMNCTVSGNISREHGGGILASTANLTNCTISGNSARNQGGGIRALDLTLVSSTITENSAHDGGGVFHLAGGTSGLRNTIIAQNFVDFTGTGPDVLGAFTSGGHNLIGDATGSTEIVNGVNGDRAGTAANPINAKLAPLANNGGPTRTHALLPGSLAIDHGDNSNLPATDQRGLPRRKDGNGDHLTLVDIGAFER